MTADRTRPRLALVIAPDNGALLADADPRADLPAYIITRAIATPATAKPTDS
jgi:hypothetical protein